MAKQSKEKSLNSLNLSLIMLPLLVFGILSCNPIENESPDVDMEYTATVLLINTGTPQAVTRTAVDEHIEDVNIYLFALDNPETSYHFYSTSRSINIEVLKGNYSAYCITNAGEDLGTGTIQEIENMFIDHSRTGLVMSSRQVIDLTNNGTQILTVERDYAKVYYEVSVNPLLETVQLHSIRLCSLPLYYNPFVGNVPDSDIYIDKPWIMLEAGSQKAEGHFYMPENIKGENNSITRPQDKTLTNAPQNATYLHIRALQDETVLDYFVFLGINNTTDFNVARNTIYSLNVTIDGVNTLDARHHNYKIHLRNENRSDFLFYTPYSSAHCYIEIETLSDIYQFSGSINIRAEDPESNHYFINYSQQSIPVDFGNNLCFAYQICSLNDQLRENAKDCYAVYNINIDDGLGKEMTFTDSILFPDWINVVISETTGDYFKGTFEVSGEYLGKEYYYNSVLRQHETTIYFLPGQELTLTAKPYNGNRFKGWYHNRTTLLSSHPVHEVSFSTTPTVLHLHFQE